MGKNFFNPEGGIWQILGFVGDIMILSMLWTVCAVPVVTAGASTAALYDAVVKGFFQKKPDSLMTFFRTFRRELKNALLPSIMWALLLAGLFWLFRLAAGQLQGNAGIVLTVVLFVVLLIPVGICCWVFPLLSRFTLSFGQLNTNSVRLALGHMPRTLMIAMLAVGGAWLTLRFALLPLFFLPAAVSLADAALMEPVFHQYEDQE